MITIYELVAPEEPPIGTNLTDRDGYVWKRDEDGWCLIAIPEFRQDWFYVIRDYGPLRSIPGEGNATPS